MTFTVLTESQNSNSNRTKAYPAILPISAWQKIHMKVQDLVSLRKKIACRLLQVFLFKGYPNP